MKPAELTALHELLESPQVTFTGDTVDRIIAIVDEVCQSLHWCETCGCRMPLAVGHPHCGICESPLLIQQCKGCNEWFCRTGCAGSHVCGGGTEPYGFEA